LNLLKNEGDFGVFLAASPPKKHYNPIYREITLN